MVKHIMRQSRRKLAVLALLGLIVSLLTVISGTAQAAPLIPSLQWPAVTAAPYYGRIVPNPSGGVTVGCALDGSGQDLTTYNASGVVTSQISRTTQIDGVSNCIGDVVGDKNGDVYGVPWGITTGTNHAFGANLLAYSGNTLKWKYPIGCTQSQPSHYAVGANGNIYATNYSSSDGYVHLIGLTPNVAAGQTQPTKVLDVKVANDCTMKVFPYRDGVMLQGQSSGFRFYSYNGNLVAQPSSVANAYYAKVNADGLLFSYSTVAGGGFTSVSVSAYNPGQNQVTWTTSASTTGANVNFTTLYPIPGGGVVVLMLEQKMYGGMPVVPTQYHWNVVTLNASGIKVGPAFIEMAGTDGSSPTITTDTSGKVIVLQQLLQATTPTGTYPATEPAVSIGTLDAGTGTVVQSGILQGNTNVPSGQLYGYSLNYIGDNGPVNGPNTLFVQARCAGSCPNNDTNTKMYPVTMTGNGMDYPRGNVLAAYPRPSTAYMALGDSFSSGESLSPFATGTDLPGVNTCHRSSSAYPSLIAGTSAKIPALGANDFRACSGAITTNLWDVAQWNEGIQTDRYPDTTTTLVTLTIGGNDIGFPAFGKACATPFSSCDVGTTAYTNAVNHINGDLAGNLTAAYQNILLVAPNAKIYVVGYPQVVANKLVTDPDDTRCPTLEGGNTKYGNARAARSIVTQLDQKISATVTAVGNSRLHYVPVDGSTSPFVGHEVCGTDPTSWFQNINQWVNNPSYVFHPNALGQQYGYAALVGAAINAG
jgi:hypothetical protein